MAYKLNMTGEQFAQKLANPQPANLLDNSDFRNPVNQRGSTTYSKSAWGGYIIDRWYVGSRESITFTINSDSCSLNGDMYQCINKTEVTEFLDGETVTLVVKADGVISWANGTVTFPGEWSAFCITEIAGGKGNTYLETDSNDNLRIYIRSYEGKTVNIEWVALYKGKYDSDTLPEYQPKGYVQELAECRRYYINGIFPVTIGSQYGGSRSLFTISIDAMVKTPNVTLSSISSQGWGNVVASNYSIGWYGLVGSTMYVNFVNSSSGDDVGKACIAYAEFSAEL